MNIQYEHAIFARRDGGAHLFSDCCVPIPFVQLAVTVLKPVHSFVASARNILNCLGRCDRLINVNGSLGAGDEGLVINVRAAVGNLVGRELELLAAVTESLVCPGSLDHFY